MDLADVKRKARSAASRRRAEAHEQFKDSAGALLAERGLPDGMGATPTVVSGFIPYKSEISTVPLLNRLRREGWDTCLPVVVAPGQPLVFRLWRPGESLVPGVWDIPMPA